VLITRTVYLGELVVYKNPLLSEQKSEFVDKLYAISAKFEYRILQSEIPKGHCNKHWMCCVQTYKTKS